MFKDLKEGTVFSKLLNDIAEIKKKGDRCHYPEDLKERCVRYIEQTPRMKRKTFADKTGISNNTINIWCRRYGSVIDRPLPTPREVIEQAPKPEKKTSGLVSVWYSDKIRIETPLELLKPVMEKLEFEAD